MSFQFHHCKAKEDKESYEKKINEIKSKYNEDKKKLQSQIDNKENVIQDLLIKVQDVQKESMLFLKNAEEKMNQKSAEYQTLYFQEQQKNSFLEEKNKDLNEQLLQLKNNNEKIMDYIKNNSKIKYLWFRTITSTIIGEFLDTTIFLTIGFVGTIKTNDLIFMIVCQSAAKTIYEIVLTPLTYKTIAYIKKKEELLK